jgi:hypothetical protein
MNWHFTLRLTAYLIISLAVLFLYSFLLGEIHIPLIIKQILAYLLLVSAGAVLLIHKIYKQHKKINKEGQQFPVLLISVVLFILLAWIYCVPSQKYPGVFSTGMGDIPEFYALAKNIYLGQGFTTNYHIFDFWTGPKSGIQDIINSPPTSGRRPLVPYVTSFFYHLSGYNNYSIYLIALILAALIPLVLYGFLYHFTLKKHNKISPLRNLIYQIVSVCMVFIPNHYLLFGLGTITLFLLVPLFIFILFIKLQNWKSPASVLIIALSAGLATTARPEGIVLVFIILLIYFINQCITILLNKSTVKTLTIFPIILIGIIILNIPVLFIPYESSSNGLWYQTLQYNGQLKKFQSIYFPYWFLFNNAIAREYLSDNPDINHIINTNIKGDISRHPLKFLRWLFNESKSKIIVFLSIYRTDSLSCKIPIITSIILTIFILIGPAREMIMILCLYLAGFSLFSPVIFQRQVITMSPPMLTAFYLTFIHLPIKKIITGFKLFPNLLNRIKHSFNKPSPIHPIFIYLLVLLLIVPVITNTGKVLDVLGNYENSKYQDSLNIITEHTEPNSIIVADYPQLVNLMTGRISLGASYLLIILNQKLEKFKPDYVLIDDCRPIKNYTGFTKEKYLKTFHREAYEYITMNYRLIEHDSKNHIMLYKHL